MSSKACWITGGVFVSVLLVKAAQSYCNSECTKPVSKMETEPGPAGDSKMEEEQASAGALLERVLTRAERVTSKIDLTPGANGSILEMVHTRSESLISKVKEVVKTRSKSVISTIKGQTRGAWCKIKTCGKNIWNRFLNYMDGGRFEVAQAAERRLLIENRHLKEELRGAITAQASTRSSFQLLEEHIRFTEQQQEDAEEEAAFLRDSNEELEAQIEINERAIIQLQERNWFLEHKEDEREAAEAAKAEELERQMSSQQ